MLLLAAANLLAVTVSAQPAYAVHYNRGAFVVAYEPCPTASANSTTSNGIAACTPAIPVSNCAADPTTALVLGDPGTTAFKSLAKGRRLTRENDGTPDIDTRIVLAGIEDCSGRPFDGSLDVEFLVRFFREDPACATQKCVVPDFAFTNTVTCSHGRCKALMHANEALEASGYPRLPLDHVYSLQILRMAVLDRAGRVFL